MRAVYIDRYFMKNDHSCVFGSVSCPILNRKEIKNNLKDIFEDILHFDDITSENVKTFYNVCSYFMKNNNMSANMLSLSSFRRKDYTNILFSLIKKEYIIYRNEPLRVYIPFDDDKTFIRNLNAMCRKRKMNVSVEEIKYEESKLSQLTNILCGCVYYHDREDLYLTNLGRKGTPQLVAYIYSCKKSFNKFNVFKKYGK